MPTAAEHDLARRAAPLCRRARASRCVRQAVTAAMRILGRQFVMGRTIEEALERARGARAARLPPFLRHARRGGAHRRPTPSATAPPTSTRSPRSARAAAGRAVDRGRPASRSSCRRLHPRYEMAQRERVLARIAAARCSRSRGRRAQAGIGFTIDAEEADRLELSLDLVEALALAPELAGWDGLGLAVQAYQKRALPLIDWLADLARRGAAAADGAAGQGRLLGQRDQARPGARARRLSGVHPQGRDRRLLSRLRQAAARRRRAPSIRNSRRTTRTPSRPSSRWPASARDYEFQRLHGMGEALYDEIVGPDKLDRPCRIYAPVGSHEDLLAYLVRRLLENGANTSFVNRIVDERAADRRDRRRPDRAAGAAAGRSRIPRIPLPRDLYRPERQQFARARPRPIRATLADLRDGARRGAAPARGEPAPIVGGIEQARRRRAGLRPERPPAPDRRASSRPARTQVEQALARAVRAAPAWDRTPADERAAILERAADLYEQHRAELMALIIREGGRTIPAALSEVREAVDFLRYYAARARADFAAPERLPGPTGERNEIALHGRGVFACISPWNFPLAIFTGQVAAALAAGNAVIAKPAEQTPLVAAAAVRLLHEAGIPGDVLHLLPGTGEAVGARAGRRSAHRRRRLHRLDRDRAARSTSTLARARRADRAADRRDRRAERDDRRFLGAARAGRRRCADLGLRQRRAALLGRCACCIVQDDIADRLLAMLAGAMAELRDRRPGAARDRCRPGHRRRGARRRCERHADADGARGPADLPLRAAARHRARHLLRAARLRDRQRRPARARGVRPDPACRPLAGRPARRGARRDRRDRLRPDPRHPQPDRRDRAPHPRRGSASATAMSTAT